MYVEVALNPCRVLDFRFGVTSSCNFIVSSNVIIHKSKFPQYLKTLKSVSDFWGLLHLFL